MTTRLQRNSRRGRSRRWVVLWLARVAVVGAVALAQGADEEQAATKAARGRVTYRIYCTNCHGAAAQGDGRLAELLKVKPADLTRLVEKDGTFPAEEVRRSIDGRDEVAGHGMREMPVWGDVFSDPSGTPEGAAAAKAKVTDLVEYLRSIQKSGD